MAEPPPGIIPAFLSGTTMEAFGLTELTEEAPFTRVSVAKILGDITFKGVISDWQPFTKQIQGYKNGDVPAEELELLVVQDTDMIYDQNFYFCITEEAAQSVIEQFTAPGAAGEG
eukprot:CAMPEP_0173452260 /NCGR_PEP_ID=MMETSP1357-20121228/48368_1 /TAXON_ID=77926 /ORGANISM="Hemiselmis rufescens, Strain PCC563" /LENGTH=114 /DNA_ID=CAMNT_0014419113 /DNA_START=46 /DNA_END=386 /DNA_ORIENTATION=-